MNPDTIALLRAESLAATLTAARDRRFRRRAGIIAFTAIALAVVTLSILPRRTPAPAPMAAAQPVAAPVVARSILVIHTAPGAVAKITTRKTATPVRFSTDPASRVERIDNAGLARCFPDKGIAVIQSEGGLAKVVVF
jgi:hypothetical protein